MKRPGFSLLVALGLLTSCASSGPSTRATDASTTVASGTTLPATTAPIATVIVTVIATAASTVPADTAAELTTPAQTSATAVGTQPKPKPTTTTKASSATTPSTAPPLYKPTNPPTLPKDHTTDVPVSGDLPNGVYWAQYSGGEKFTPTVEIREAFFGAACIAEASKDGTTCEDDIYIPDTPDREFNLALATNVKLTVSDGLTQKSYQITPDELVRIRAASPSDGAPEGYSFTPFAFLTTIVNGKVTKFEQVWTP